MKIKNGFDLRSVCGANIIVATGRENIDFSKVISLNESASLMWKAVHGREFTLEDMVDVLTQEYEVDAETATKDAQAIVDQWVEIGLVEQ